MYAAASPPLMSRKDIGSGVGDGPSDAALTDWPAPPAPAVPVRPGVDVAMPSPRVFPVVSTLAAVERPVLVVLDPAAPADAVRPGVAEEFDALALPAPPLAAPPFAAPPLPEPPFAPLPAEPLPPALDEPPLDACE